MYTIKCLFVFFLYTCISLQQGSFDTPIDDDTVKSVYGMNGFMGAKARYTNPPESYNFTDRNGRQLKYLFFLSRHGPRHSLNTKKAQQIVDLLSNADKQKSLLKPELLEAAQEFLKIESDNLGTLSNLAEPTIYNISKYMYSNHQSYFEEVSHEHPIYFLSSYKIRCNQTMHIFHDKLIDLGIDKEGIIINPSEFCSFNISNPFDFMKLRGYEVCKKYQDYHTSRPWEPLLQQIIEKEKGHLLEELMLKIFTSEYVKSMKSLYDSTKLIYDTCNVINNLDAEPTPFCEIFNDELLHLMNYLNDIDAYYDKGPYTPLNYVFSCPLFKDLLDILESSEFNKEKGKFYFGHNESIFPFLSFFGLFKENGTFREPRLFRTSLIYPMSSNVLLEILTDEEHKYVVRFILNGKEIKLPNCDLFCPIGDLVKIIKDEISHYEIKNCTIEGLEDYCEGFQCDEEP